MALKTTSTPTPANTLLGRMNTGFKPTTRPPMAKTPHLPSTKAPALPRLGQRLTSKTGTGKVSAPPAVKSSPSKWK